MLGDHLLDADIAAARDLIRRPPPVPKQAASFSAWNTLTAAPRGAAAGVAQTGGFFSDVLGAFGQALDATGTAGAGGMFAGQTQAERQSSDAAAAKMRREGLDFNSEAGDSFRSVARGYAPDPETAHAAERLVFDFARFATKAVGYSVAAGPVVGAGLTGADEALAASDDLRLQGVDLGTRSAAGAVIGAASALGVGLPMAGRTALGTTGLVALGGPGAFMAQQAGVRKILQDADYSKLAEQYDPFDPVGLAVSTLVPAGFGAWAMRGAKARARAPEVKPAEPMAEPMKPAETPRAEVAPEVQDAARVVLADMERARANPFRADDLSAAGLHQTALARAVDQMASGERVQVNDVFVQPDLTAARAAADEIQALQTESAALLPEATGLAEPGAIRTARQELALMEQQRPATSEADIKALAKEIQAEQGISYKAALSEAKKQTEQALADFEARQQRIQQTIDTNARAQRATQRLGEIEKRVAELEAQAGPELKLARFERALLDYAAAGRPEPPTTGAAPDAAAPARAEANPPKPQAADAGSPAAQAQADAPAAGSAAPKAGLVDDGAAMRVAEIEAAQPDMLVQLDGMDAPRPLSEVMAAVKAEADDLIADGDLMQQAAVCALLNGQ